MNLTKIELETLHTLAHQYMEIATLPVQKEKLELWKAFNRRDHVRPMITINQLPWNELNYDGSLTCICKDPFLHTIEEQLRRQIYQWRHFPVDMVVEPILTIPFCVSNTGYGLAPEDDRAYVDTDNSVCSHNFHNQLEDEEDLEKIKDMKITLDTETSKDWMQAASYIFDGILPLRQAGGTNVRLQIWDVLGELMSVEDIYYDLIDCPEFIHAIMEKMTHSALEGIRQMNELGLFDTSANSCHCSGTYTDELLPDFGAGTGNDSKHSWSYSMAQVFTSTSPETTKEFEVPYMSQLSSQFGMFYYGCCERLDDRLDIVQQIPNIKKISCSPWSHKENFAANLRKDIIMSNKPSPAFLAAPELDLDLIRKDLMETYQIAHKNGISVEFLLKDLSTVKHEVKRLEDWSKCAMALVESL